MSTNPRPGEHVTVLLGAYAVGRVDDEERGRVERHLPDCEVCREDLDYIIDVPDVFAGLTLADVEDLRPAPSMRRLRPARRPTVLAAAAAVFVLLAGLGGWLLLSRLATATAAPAAQPAAKASGGYLGVSLAVALTPTAGGLQVQATMRGLDAGASYQVLVATVDGQARTVISIVAAPGEQVARVEVALALDQISFVALIGPDGAVLVRVPFAGGAAAPSPPGTSPVR